MTPSCEPAPFCAAAAWAAYAGDSPAGVAVVDVNGDGRPDLASSAVCGGVSVLLSACFP